MPNEEIERLRSQVASGKIALSEVPLHLEPLLFEARGRGPEDRRVNKLINDLELIFHTRRKRDQRQAVLRLLDEAAKLIQ